MTDAELLGLYRQQTLDTVKFIDEHLREISHEKNVLKIGRHLLKGYHLLLPIVRSTAIGDPIYLTLERKL